MPTHVYIIMLNGKPESVYHDNSVAVKVLEAYKKKGFNAEIISKLLR